MALLTEAFIHHSVSINHYQNTILEKMRPLQFVYNSYTSEYQAGLYRMIHAHSFSLLGLHDLILVIHMLYLSKLFKIFFTGPVANNEADQSTNPVHCLQDAWGIQQPKPCLNWKTIFTDIGIHSIEIRHYYHHVILILGILILEITVFILRQGPGHYIDCISMGQCKKDVTPLLTHWNYILH